MKPILKEVYMEEDRGLLGMKSPSYPNNNLTPSEKLIIYNMIFDRYYNIITQIVHFSNGFHVPTLNNHFTRYSK